MATTVTSLLSSACQHCGASLPSLTTGPHLRGCPSYAAAITIRSPSGVMVNIHADGEVELNGANVNEAARQLWDAVGDLSRTSYMQGYEQGKADATTAN